MSLHTFKKKGIILSHQATKQSGKPSQQIWLSQGPFGSHSSESSMLDATEIGPSGFSINGPFRSNTYIGKSSAYSKMGTRYRGTEAIGYGGTCGKYPRSEPLWNLSDSRASLEGNQSMFIKPSVLSTKGMLEKKYGWIHHGQYPNHWVQPIYPSGTLDGNTSQQQYIHSKITKESQKKDTNQSEKYEKYILCHEDDTNNNEISCQQNIRKRVAISTYNSMASQGTYTKTLHIPQESNEYITFIQKHCSNPGPKQKPNFPFAVRTGKLNCKTCAPIPIDTIYNTTTPTWYLNQHTCSSQTDNPTQVVV